MIIDGRRNWRGSSCFADRCFPCKDAITSQVLCKWLLLLFHTDRRWTWSSHEELRVITHKSPKLRLDKERCRPLFHGPIHISSSSSLHPLHLLSCPWCLLSGLLFWVGASACTGSFWFLASGPLIRVTFSAFFLCQVKHKCALMLLEWFDILTSSSLASLSPTISKLENMLREEFQHCFHYVFSTCQPNKLTKHLSAYIISWWAGFSSMAGIISLAVLLPR